MNDMNQSAPPKALERGRRFASWILSAILALILFGATWMKLNPHRPADATALFAELGLSDHLGSLATIDALLGVMVLVPRLSPLAMFLLFAYWGGATATVLTHGHQPVG